MDDTAQLIHDIYEVAIDPTCWRPLLDTLLTRLGGPGEGRAVLFSDDEDNTLPLTYAQVRFNDDDEIAYQQHYAPLNPWTRRMMALPQGVALCGDLLVERKTLLAGEFYDGFLKPRGLEDAVGATLLRFGGRHVFLSLLLPKALSAMAESPMERFTPLVRHLERATAVMQRTNQFNFQAQTAFDALNCLPLGIVLVDSRGRIIGLNVAAEAILNARDGLNATRDGLRAERTEQNEALALAIREAADSVGMLTGEARWALSVDRPSGAQSYSLLVVPVRPSAELPVFDLGSTRAAAMITITDRGGGPRIDAATLRKWFDFTPAEARVALALLDGKSAAEFAGEAGISVGTARWYVKQLLAKTGTRSQKDLVGLILRSVPR